jgi:putative hydrolase of the HAD superfamily
VKDLPRAVLFDLDDTLVLFDGVGRPAWREVCARRAPALGLPPEALFEAIQQVARAYWSDAERHRMGRLALLETRVALVAEALVRLGRPDAAGARALADEYSALQESRIELFPDALPVLEALRAAGVGLALVTNGNAMLQRRKIDRFGLDRYFTACLVEGELGFGKPDRRVFEAALGALGTGPEETSCVGDNLVWDVGAAQALGIHGVWKDTYRRGLGDSPVRPDRTILQLAELLPRPAPLTP